MGLVSFPLNSLPDCVIPTAKGYPSGQGTRIVQPLYEGAGYTLEVAEWSFARILLWFTAVSPPVTLSLALYRHTPNAYPCERVAAVDFAPVVGANEVALPNPVVCGGGDLFLLLGRSSATGSATVRVYSAPNFDLLNRNVDPAYFPTRYTTALAASLGAPATFDPRNAPGGQAIESLVDLSLSDYERHEEGMQAPMNAPSGNTVPFSDLAVGSPFWETVTAALYLKKAPVAPGTDNAVKFTDGSAWGISPSQQVIPVAAKVVYGS